MRLCISTAQRDNINKTINNHEADIYIFPECALTGYGNNEFINTCDIKSFGKNVFLGASVEESDGRYNEYLFISKNGDIYKYKKTHLGINEKKIYKRGSELALFNVEGIFFGSAICIESHMSEITQTLCRNGAEVIIYPFATPLVCGSREKIWDKYLNTRAYDNNTFVIATNLYGGIMAVSPDGETIIKEYERDTVVIDINIDEVHKLRNSDKKNFNKRLDKEVLKKVSRYGV